MRVFLYILIFVVLIPIALVLGVSLVLSNPDLYRDRVAQTFQSQTGLELSINGDIGWRFWPLIALNVNDVEVRSPRTDTPLAQLQRAAIDLELLPLLFGSDNIAIDGISVNGLKVNLELDANGKGNWDTSAIQEATQKQPRENEGQQAENTFNLDISDIRINNAEIEYKDIAAKQHYRVEITSLSTGRIAYNTPIDLQANFFLEDKVAGISSRTDANGQLSFNQNFDQFGFSSLKLNSMISVPDLPELRPEVTLTGKVNTDKGTASFESVLARLDDSTLQGTLTLSSEDKTTVEFDFHLDRFNVSNYLPSESEPRETSGGEGAGKAADMEIIPTDMLNEYAISGRLRIDELLYDTYRFAPVDLVVNNKQQRLTAELTAQGYEGEFNMKVAANTGAQTNGTIDLNITGVDITQLTEWEWITGTFNAESATRFKGRMLSELLESIDGPTDFTIDDGTLDVTPVKNLAGTIDALRGKTSSISEWPDKMAFEHLDGTHQLNDGIEANQIFGFQLENLKVAGTGGVDYWQDQLDYELQVMLDQTESGKFKVNERLAGVNWPLHCKGRLDESPVELCFADKGAIQEMVTDVAKQEVKREARDKVEKKIEEKVPEDMREDAKKLLKGLFDD